MASMYYDKEMESLPAGDFAGWDRAVAKSRQRRSDTVFFRKRIIR